MISLIAGAVHFRNWHLKSIRSHRLYTTVLYATLCGGIALGSIGIANHLRRPRVVFAQLANCPGFQSPGGIWPIGPITVYFNNTLDFRLESPAGHGDLDTRWDAFNKAVDDWNVVLATLPPPGQPALKLVAMQTMANWGIDQTVAKCTDAVLAPFGAPAWNVYLSAVHNSLGLNVASTGNNPNGINKDPNGVPLLPGWVFNTQNGSQFGPADLLGITYPTVVPPGLMTQANVGWMTHFSLQQGAQSCLRIPWDYRLIAGPGDPTAPPDNVFEPPIGYSGGDNDGGTTPCNGAANCGYYDFYSVMLHELGHVLGLGHQSPNAANNNVMQKAIPAGVRYEVGAPGDPEAACLKQMYYPPAASTAADSPTLPEWGTLLMAFALISFSIWQIRSSRGSKFV